jgi:cytochrome b561
MAVLVIAQLFIGAGMVSTVSPRYHFLLSVHRPIGALILTLVAIRLVNRLLSRVPPLPAHMPRWQQLAAHGSHIAIYALMLLVPLDGWAMLSAGNYPIVLFGAWHLPPILHPAPMLYATLRGAHMLLAYLLFAVFLVHLGAALMHALVYRDNVFRSMAP